jgi:2-hydroxychromene-2-carboxylate isomerase
VRDDSHVSSSEAPRFYLGAMSPYSWFAAERIERLLPSARWRGVFAGALFKQNGRVSWGLTDERERKLADCEARAASHALGPIRWPEPWPTNDLLVARAMAFCRDQELLKAYALAAMRLSFLDGADLGELDAVLEAGRRVGVDEHELAAALQREDVKDALRAANDEAIAAGAFGVPTVVVGDELFWGDDRLDEAAAAYRADS